MRPCFHESFVVCEHIQEESSVSVAWFISLVHEHVQVESFVSVAWFVSERSLKYWNMDIMEAMLDELRPALLSGELVLPFLYVYHIL